MGPKKGKIIARNHIGITTGNLASALKHILLVSCIPITFSHTKYNGVQANPNVMNCINLSGKGERKLVLGIIGDMLVSIKRNFNFC